ncbi:hypothetical protein [Schlesneria sp. DSM 10557]|uniref:hypothetical protein n=1 Tax=Schlesneria sp. DSM 10557 TaxID=3044399 RepID=UPI0035C86F84
MIQSQSSDRSGAIAERLVKESTVFARKLAYFSVALVGWAAGTAYAQPEARLRIVAPSLGAAEDDLKWMIELSPTPDLRKQWKPFKENLLDAFTQGVDLSKPVSLDLVFRKDELGYEGRIPVKDLTGKNTGFLPNLRGMGYLYKPLGQELYQVNEKNKKPFFLRYDKNYAWMATTKEAIPANRPPAAQELQPLLDLKKDFLAELKNDAAGLDKRRENFQELRKQFEALIRFKRNEDPNAFQLRKLALVHQLDEAERFLVETEALLATWTTNAVSPNGTGRGELSISALPGTDLAKSVEEFAVKPSYFANVPLHENPIAVGRITFPLDSSRVAHLTEFYKAVRPVLQTEIKSRKGYTDAQKDATAKASDIFLDMLESGLSLGVVDAFADAHEVGEGKTVMVTGIRVVDGKRADEIVQLISQFKSGWQVKLDVHEHAGVKIHELTVPESRIEAFQKVFPGENKVYVGTSGDAIWGAAGVECLTHLQAAIDEAAKPAPEKANPVFVNYQLQLGKIVKLAEVIQKDLPSGPGLTKDQQQQVKDLEKYRKLASDAMLNCESLIQGELRRNDNKIEGFVEVSECVLKFVGSIVADGAKQLK